MKNIKISRLFATMMFVAVLAFTGCTQQVEEKITYFYVLPIESGDALIADWVDNTAAHYVITQSSFDNYGSWGDSYAGNNLVVLKQSDTAGTIFIKYTRAMNPDYSYTTTAPDVGKWYAVSYKSLTDTSVEIAGAANYTNGGVSSCDTLEEAKEEFTIEKGYFETHDTFVKQ